MNSKKTIHDLQEWFEKEVSSELSTPRKIAQKQLNIIKDKIDEIRDSALRFDYSDIKEPDVYQNYATSIYKKTIEKLDEFQFPENVTFDNLEEFYSQAKNIITSYIDLLAKYLTWLKRDRSYKSKVKNLDRSITRFQQELNKLNTKTLEFYSPYQKYERVIDDLVRLQELVNRRKELNNEIESLRGDVERLDKMINERAKELEELEGHPGFNQIKANKNELDHIDIQISGKINEIKKLANKVLKAANSRKLEISAADKETLRALIKDPLSELIREMEGYNGIKATLKNLKELGSDKSVQMKKDKLDKAFENIDEIINDGLLELQKRAKYLTKQTEAINAKFEEMEINRKISKLKREIEDLKIDKDRITLTQRRELNEINEEIESLVSSIIERIEEYTGKRFEIDLSPHN